MERLLVMDLPPCSAADWTIVEQLSRLRSDELREEDTSHYFSNAYLFLGGTSMFLMTRRLPVRKETSIFTRRTSGTFHGKCMREPIRW